MGWEGVERGEAGWAEVGWGGVGGRCALATGLGPGGLSGPGRATGPARARARTGPEGARSGRGREAKRFLPRSCRPRLPLPPLALAPSPSRPRPRACAPPRPHSPALGLARLVSKASVLRAIDRAATDADAQRSRTPAHIRARSPPPPAPSVLIPPSNSFRPAPPPPPLPCPALCLVILVPAALHGRTWRAEQAGGPGPRAARRHPPFLGEHATRARRT